MFERLIKWWSKKDVEEMMDERIGAYMSVVFAKTETYLTDRVDSATSMAINDMHHNARETVDRKVDRAFKEDGFIPERIRSSVREEVKTVAPKLIQGEEFIDTVIGRINKKQLS